MAGALAVAAAGCRSKEHAGPPVPASADPEGRDLVAGAIVAADERGTGYRLYKVVDVLFFPPPMSDEIVLVAYEAKGTTLQEASSLYARGNLRVALPTVRVQRHLFRTRDYRVLANEPVTDTERAGKAGEPTEK